MKYRCPNGFELSWKSSTPAAQMPEVIKAYFTTINCPRISKISCFNVNGTKGHLKTRTNKKTINKASNIFNMYN
tara:strand:+ start:446 stop:667 length:222 start_codon:yes stop_codon:yes gene_type:complete